MASAVDPLRPGDRVDQYQILRLVGSGGMGEVYAARDTTLGRRVALKVIRPEVLSDPQSAEQFLREARITARFNHPNIVTLYGVGEYGGTPYVALEYLEGDDLRTRHEREQLGVREAVRVALAIASALTEAHRHGVQHRDLKPENVMLPADGRPRVLDFGLAKRIYSGRMSLRTTNQVKRAEAARIAAEVRAESRPSGRGGPRDTVAEASSDAPPDSQARGPRGTPAYMSPEQWEQKDLTPATDIWALGVLLFELLSGEHPIGETSIGQLVMVVTSDDPCPPLASANPNLPTALLELVDSCLRKNPKARPTAQEVVEALEAQLEGERRGVDSEQRPYRGLLPFTERHAGLFFGREAEIAAFVERLREVAVLPVVGPSGAGKSSFVQAGVIPRLREQGPLTVLRLRPGGLPFQTLAQRLLSEVGATESFDVVPGPSASKSSGPTRSLPSADAVEQLADRLRENPGLLALELAKRADAEPGRVLLFVDQLEELHVQVRNTEVRASFMSALCNAADDPEGPVRVVLTLRDDFLGRLSDSADSQQVLSRAVVLRRLGRRALKQALVGPAELAGHTFEHPALVRSMLDEVQGEPAALPLLQFAAQRLWELRDPKKRRLTRAAYTAIGGVSGALAQHADDALGTLSAEQERLCKQLLLRLVTAEGTRRWRTEEALLDGLDDRAANVLSRLTAARIVLSRKGAGGVELELVHESLIRSWERLAHWLEEHHEERLFLADVGQAAELWDRRGRLESEVWRGDALQEARLKSARATVLPPLVSAFLAAGHHRQRRQIRRRRLFLISLTTLLALIAVVLGGLNVALRRQKRETLKQRRDAEAERRRAVGEKAEVLREGARAALLRGDLQEARAKLRLALEIRDSRLARALWWQLEQNPLLWQKRVPMITYDAALSPDGQVLVTGSQDKAVYLHSLGERRTRVLRGHQDQVGAVAFSPDGRYVASADWKGTVRLWTVAKGASRELLGHRHTVRGLQFSPDGRWLASAGSDKQVILWQSPSGTRALTLTGHQDRVRRVAFGPRGRLLATASADRTARLWHLPSGNPIHTLRHPSVVQDVAVDPQRRWVATSASDGVVRLWDVSTGALVRRMVGHQHRVYRLAFSPDGRFLVSGGHDETARVWDSATGHLRAVLNHAGQHVFKVLFTADGKRLLTQTWDSTFRLWDLEAALRMPRQRGHTGNVQGVSFAPTGERLATGSNDGTVKLWDTLTGRVRATLRGHTKAVRAVAFSPDGGVLASSGVDRTIRLWSGETHRLTRVLLGHEDRVMDLAWSPNGRLLASASNDRTVRIWDPASGRSLRTLSGQGSMVWGVTFSLDGKTLVGGCVDGKIRTWDVDSGRLARSFQAHGGVVRGVRFDAKGTWLASGGADGTVKIWTPGPWSGRTVGSYPTRILWLDLHPHGRVIGAPAVDGLARLIDLRSGVVRTLRGHRDEVNYLRFSADGRWVATTSDDQTVRLWRSRDGRPRWRAPLLLARSRRLASHRGWIHLGSGHSRGRASTNWERAVISSGRRAAVDPAGKRMCLWRFDGHLEQWDLSGDRRLSRRSLPRVTRLLARAGDCLVVAGGKLHRVTPDVSTEWAVGVTGLSTFEGRAVVATLRDVRILNNAGQTTWRDKTSRGATAVGRVGDSWVLGYREGHLSLLPTRSGQALRLFSFEDVPSSAVIRLLPGPPDTVLAAFANGEFGLWSTTNGLRLHHGRLHGAVVHLQRDENQYFIASELGDYRVLDFRTFSAPYCAVLQRIWEKVPVIWEGGLPRPKPAPLGHRCRRSRPLR